MKAFLRLLLFSFLVGIIFANPCKEIEANDLEECSNTEYQTYVDCIRKRSKRSANCYQESECDQCDCNYCQTNHCESTCSSCCTQNVCSTHHCCHKSCNLQCKTSSCKKSCRRDCADKIQTQHDVLREKEVVVVHGGNVAEQQQHNITTIINLHNMINNTNQIDIPVTLNNTNFNNITLDSSDLGLIQTGGGGVVSGGTTIIHQYAKDEKCCRIIGPRQCVPITDYPYQRCFHVRTKHCGHICQTSVMHAQKHEICDGYNEQKQPSCRDQLIYIPQPRPRCFHQEKWPYVGCGMLESECEGCYAHHSSKKTYGGGCSSSCFDDGYGLGPMYRQGPYYRPGYSPVPSCMQLGTCAQGGMYGYPQMTQGGYNGIPLYGGAYPPYSYNLDELKVNQGVPSDILQQYQNAALMQGSSGVMPGSSGLMPGSGAIFPDNAGNAGLTPGNLGLTQGNYGIIPGNSGLIPADFYHKISNRATEKTGEVESGKAPAMVSIETSIANPVDANATKNS